MPSPAVPGAVGARSRVLGKVSEPRATAAPRLREQTSPSCPAAFTPSITINLRCRRRPHGFLSNWGRINPLNVGSGVPAPGIPPTCPHKLFTLNRRRVPLSRHDVHADPHVAHLHRGAAPGLPRHQVELGYGHRGRAGVRPAFAEMYSDRAWATSYWTNFDLRDWVSLFNVFNRFVVRRELKRRQSGKWI